MKFAFGTDVGRVRSENQDSCDAFEYNNAVFALVADGMGGHSGGSVASQIAKDAARRIIEAEYDEKMSDTKLAELLKSCISAANIEIYERSQRQDELDGMGTTMVLAALRDKKALILNVGDSRAYAVSEKEIKQITKDQSYVQHLVDIGEISASEAEGHPQKNVIMQAVGASVQVRADVYEIQCAQGYILLCSDGLSGKIDSSQIQKIICDKEQTPEERTQRLIAEANASGGEDNITAVLIEI